MNLLIEFVVSYVKWLIIIFGYGDLVFSGTGSQTVVFKMVPNPLEVKKAVQETI